MTQSEIDLLKLLQSEQKAENERFDNATREHRERLDHLCNEKYKITFRCDHKWPDGRWATQGEWMCSYCKICGLTDL